MIYVGFDMALQSCLIEGIPSERKNMEKRKMRERKMSLSKVQYLQNIVPNVHIIRDKNCIRDKMAPLKNSTVMGEVLLEQRCCQERRLKIMRRIWIGNYF